MYFIFSEWGYFCSVAFYLKGTNNLFVKKGVFKLPCQTLESH